jgi:eukaryotic-like serine/threonine-protein kinase
MRSDNGYRRLRAQTVFTQRDSKGEAELLKVWQFTLMLAALGLVFLVGLLSFNFILMPRLVHRHTEVRVPDLTGLSASEANTLALQFDLTMEIAHSDAHPTAPVDQIIDQRPRAGTAIRSARKLLVVTSNGPPVGSIPQLRGLTAKQAESSLQRESFRMGRSLTLRRPGTVAGAVGLQNPGSSTSLRKGEAVDLLFYDPKLGDAYMMPDLRGQSLFAVRDRVGRTGCPMAPVRYRRDNSLPPNTIVGQTPLPGTRIMKGETIALVASTR